MLSPNAGDGTHVSFDRNSLRSAHDADVQRAEFWQQNELRPLLEKVGELIRAQKYAEATPLAERSAVMLEKALGPDHPVVAEMLYNLGELYRHTARYADAEVVYKRMLAIREKTLGPGNKDVPPALDALKTGSPRPSASASVRSRSVKRRSAPIIWT